MFDCIGLPVEDASPMFSCPKCSALCPGRLVGRGRVAHMAAAAQARNQSPPKRALSAGPSSVNSHCRVSIGKQAGVLLACCKDTQLLSCAQLGQRFACSRRMERQFLNYFVSAANPGEFADSECVHLLQLQAAELPFHGGRTAQPWNDASFVRLSCMSHPQLSHSCRFRTLSLCQAWMPEEGPAVRNWKDAIHSAADNLPTRFWYVQV